MAKVSTFKAVKDIPQGIIDIATDALPEASDSEKKEFVNAVITLFNYFSITDASDFESKIQNIESQLSSTSASIHNKVLDMNRKVGDEQLRVTNFRLNLDRKIKSIEEDLVNSVLQDIEDRRDGYFVNIGNMTEAQVASFSFFDSVLKTAIDAGVSPDAACQAASYAVWAIKPGSDVPFKDRGKVVGC